MSELNSLIVMSFAKIYRINLKHPRKIFLLRLLFVIQVIICSIKFQIEKRKYKKKILKSENINFFKWLFFRRISKTITKILFHFLSGTYSIGLIYYSLSKEILSLPFFISGF